jgi:hypothetical protein
VFRFRFLGTNLHMDRDHYRSVVHDPTSTALLDAVPTSARCFDNPYCFVGHRGNNRDQAYLQSDGMSAGLRRVSFDVSTVTKDN